MKLHLGCGKRHIPGFVHIDAVEYPHVDHVATIDHLGFLPDDSVELIYNCHVLEHFRRNDVARVLREWRRVLRPGALEAGDEVDALGRVGLELHCRIILDSAFPHQAPP